MAPDTTGGIKPALTMLNSKAAVVTMYRRYEPANAKPAPIVTKKLPTPDQLVKLTVQSKSEAQTGQPGAAGIDTPTLGAKTAKIAMEIKSISEITNTTSKGLDVPKAICSFFRWSRKEKKNTSRFRLKKRLGQLAQVAQPLLTKSQRLE